MQPNLGTERWHSKTVTGFEEAVDAISDGVEDLPQPLRLDARLFGSGHPVQVIVNQDH